VSWYDYQRAKELYVSDVPFYALIMAAMLKADSRNSALLGAVFGALQRELDARYNAPGGKLPGDDEPINVVVTVVSAEELQAMAEREIVHRCPARGDGRTQCCGQVVFDLPRDHRMTDLPGLVTCRGEDNRHEV
jgi:hypothetical protein